MSEDKDIRLQHLKARLAITSKTTSLLYDAGYTTPQSLANSSPNEVIAKFAALPSMDMKKAKEYGRGLRRMVVLGAVEESEEAARLVADCKNWSNKELTRKGIYDDGFDDLTGVQIWRRMRSRGYEG